jgi:transcriptional regulator of acetoin/glycerol metabolism
MSTLLKSIRQPLGTILPLGELKRQVIVDALDKCGGNYLLAAHLLGIGRTTIYRISRMYRYQ